MCIDHLIPALNEESAVLLDICSRLGMKGIVEARMGLIQNRWKDDESLQTVASDVRQAVDLRTRRD
jgi:hypothetical protein